MPRRPWVIAGGALVILVPLALSAIATLNVAYSSGDMMDLGWLSFLAWHSDVALTGPPASFGESFFVHHVSPIFWLTSLISYVLPLGRVSFYALLMGAIYALYAAGVYRAWRLAGQKDSGTAALGGAALAIMATFSAAGMQALRLPHYEMAIPALALWFLLDLAEGRRRAALWFGLCLLVREDAGFHLFGLLALWALALKIARRREAHIGNIIGYATIAVFYSLLAMFFQHQVFPAAHQFAHIYAGNPPWAHVTADFLKKRLSFFLIERTTITLPFLATILWAWRARNPLLPLGYLAFVPWIVLNLLAVRVTAGALGFYYMFPLWLSLAWPLLALRLWPAAKSMRRWPWLVVLLFSLIGWHKDGPIVYPLANNEFDTCPFAITEGLRHRDAAENFAAYFGAHQDLFMGRVDMPVFSLLMASNDRMNWLATGHRYMSEPPPDAPPLPKMVIYYARSFEYPLWVAPVLKTGVYDYFYAVPGTRIRLASQKSLDAFPAPTPFVAMARPAY